MFNKNGLTFLDWIKAAERDCDQTSLRAWNEGQDPSDWRAEQAKLKVRKHGDMLTTGNETNGIPLAQVIFDPDQFPFDTRPRILIKGLTCLKPSELQAILDWYNNA
jgi:hypothetical protein